MSENTKIFTRGYVLLCLSSFLFFSSFNMLLPELPDYLTSLGGADYKGLIIGIFTLTAGFSRPFSGRLTDRWGRIPTMLIGAGVCVLVGLIYPIAQTVFLFLALRLIHGFSTGFKPTGTAAYIADIVPVSRRGEAMGIYGFVTSMGMAFGPVIGSWVASVTSMNTLFYLSSVFAFLSVAILFGMKETLPESVREPFSFKMFRIGRKDLFYPPVWPVTVVVFLTSFSYGCIVTLSPDLTKIMGIENKGLYFLLFTISSLFIRITAGKVSDRYGRIPVLIAGIISLVISMLLTSIISHIFFFVAGAIFFGLAWGVISPSYQAWTVDLSDDHTRGRAIATMYISLEAGIGCGAVIPMFVYQNEPSQIVWAFRMCVLVAAAALIFLVAYHRKQKQLAA